MQFMDCQVTTIRCAGYTDTVCEKTNLYNDTEDLSNYIVRLLKNNEYDNKIVMEYIKKFSVENVIDRWEQLLLELERNKIEITVLRDGIYYVNLCLFYIGEIKDKIKYTMKVILSWTKRDN